MSDKPISPFKPVSNLEYFLFATIFFYLGFHRYVNYLHNPNELSVGYVDYTSWARPLDDLLQGLKGQFLLWIRWNLSSW